MSSLSLVRSLVLLLATFIAAFETAHAMKEKLSLITPLEEQVEHIALERSAQGASSWGKFARTIEIRMLRINIKRERDRERERKKERKKEINGMEWNSIR